jgi:hypothetical protein
MEKNKSEQALPELISYLLLRKLVGILGIALPPVLIAGSFLVDHCREVQDSISVYYYTGMRNAFVGIICAIALFLFTYKGYERIDNITGNLGGLFALGVALFPTSYTRTFSSCLTGSFDQGIVGDIHVYASAGFFMVIAFYALFLFTKSTENPTPGKLRRNKLYRACGILILICMVLLGIYIFLERRGRVDAVSIFTPEFWLETIALWAFGLSWLTKGKALLRDRQEKIGIDQ